MPSLSMSPTASPRPRRLTLQGSPAEAETSRSRPPPSPRISIAGMVNGTCGLMSVTWPLACATSSTAVVVDVQERQAEAEDVPRRGRQADRRGSIDELGAAEALIEGRRFAEEVGDGQVEPAVAVEVAAGDAHAGAVAPFGVGRHACVDRDLAELPVPFVVEQVVGGLVVGDEQVEAAVVVEVGRDHAQSPRPRDRPW